MNIITFLLKQSRKAVLLSVIAGIFSGACNAALLAIINLVVKRSGSTATLVWSFIGLCLLLPLTRFTSEFFLSYLGQEATYNMRMRLCRQILAAPLRQLEQIGAPRLLSTLTDDVSTIANAILVVPLLCVNSSLVIGCLVYMGILSPLLLVTVLGFMVIGTASYQIPVIKAQKLFVIGRKDGATLHGHFRALTQGTKELKIHAGRQDAFLNQELKATADSLRRHNRAAENIYSAASSWGQSLVFVLVGVILFVLPGFHPVSSAMMASYALTILYFMTPLQIVLNMLPQLGRANVALKNTQELGLTLSGQASEKIAEMDSFPGSWHKLEVKSITHAYRREGESEDFVLGPIDLSFTPGELVFITGGNGSGKTTLIKLLAGLYLPESGYISMDDERIGKMNKELYRQSFSVVFSDFYLFEQMLGLINPKLDDQARRYLTQLKLSHKVEIVNGKFSTIELSQGQRKRLALLTAYLEDRPIYIFDEWAADQDPQFKAIFYLQLLPELKAKGKTVFVVSHDDRYYHIADRVIKLDEGQISSDTASELETASAAPVGCHDS